MENTTTNPSSQKPLLRKGWGRPLTRLSSWLKNKYIVAIAVFAVIMLFFDRSDVFTQLSRTRQLRELEESKQYYISKIAAERKELENLRSNPLTIEKYAREKYLMKRDKEELFVIPENQAKGK